SDPTTVFALRKYCMESILFFSEKP
ncbi:hypothetical protein EVA_18838, partial [gut metagenome]